MCGRFSQHWDMSQWDEIWPAQWPKSGYEPRYNVAPGTNILALSQRYNNHSVGRVVTWGIKTPRSFLINARAESLNLRPTFRSLLSKNRLIIPMNGYYEWHQHSRQPYYIQSQGSECLWALGLYQPSSGMLSRAVILTQPAMPSVSAIHSRMPVLVSRELAEDWLNPATDQYRDVLNGLVSRTTRLIVQPVSIRVNKSLNQGADLVQAIDP